ncbi:MAG: efflux RND transporter permease subunit [Thermoflavifilum sp.]|nr:efflux RND transporter permease subunit [Thermoflavifilum sp.]
MIERLISWSIRNRFTVTVFTLGLLGWGIYALMHTPVDAIPDLSDVQVIVFTEWPGRGPQVIEDQITFPLVSSLQGIPKVKDIRGTSMFGMSFVYVVFEDGTDPYWARSRVLERLSYAQKQLPPDVVPTLGPDATGVGQVFWYTLEGKGYDLGTLRSIQDWYVKFALQDVPGVSEVASFGGFQPQYQVRLDPHKLTYYHISLEQVIQAIQENNRDVGGSVIDLNGTNYIVRGLGYLKKLDDLEQIPVATVGSTPILLKDIAQVQMGGDHRLGFTDENGQGEVVGGVVIMRYGANADAVIRAVKEKMKSVQAGLPPGVEFHIAYDRSTLIESAIHSIQHTLIEEVILVSIIIIVFLFHVRSALVAILTIPIAVVISFIFIHWMGFNSNIMSLSGIAIAIGVIADASIVMIENAHRHLTENN